VIEDIDRATRMLSTTAVDRNELTPQQQEQLRSLSEGALRMGATHLRCEPEALREVYAFLTAARVDPTGR
jgi:hypothetical protein